MKPKIKITYRVSIKRRLDELFTKHRFDFSKINHMSETSKRNIVSFVNYHETIDGAILSDEEAEIISNIIVRRLKQRNFLPAELREIKI